MKKQTGRDWPIASYLRVIPFGHQALQQRRNVPLEFDPGVLPYANNWHFSPFSWRHAKTYEQGPDHDTVTGCWGANYRRMSRIFGDPGLNHFGRVEGLESATEETFRLGRLFRPSLYYRNASLVEIRNAVLRGEDIRLGLEVGSEWYDPPQGRIEFNSVGWEPLGSHAVPLGEYDPKEDRYYFENSWGYQWGGKGLSEDSRPYGCGSIPGILIQQRVVESWTGMPVGLDIPSRPDLGFRELHWKWIQEADFGVHVREIREGENRCGWAFCIARDGYLTVDEFFVAPEYRARGFARLLCKAVQDLAEVVKKPIRLLLSFAESGAESKEMRDAVARMFGVTWRPSKTRFCYMVADSRAEVSILPAWDRIPCSPATILERLRPLSETPIYDKRIFSVHFGTDRQKRARPNGVAFADTRGRRLHLGTASVSVPSTHRFGSIGRWHSRRWPKGNDDHLRVLNITPKSSDDFARDAGGMRLQIGDDCRHLLFIHGYNVSFEEATIRCAQLGFDLKVSGHTFLYSWPSAGRMLRYRHDEATVEAAFPYFCDYMELIASQLDGEGLSVITHSMGNRLIVRWLEQQRVVRPNLQSLAFCAADVDTDTFSNGLKSLSGIAGQATIYVAVGDIPLFMSKFVHGYNRAGIAPPFIQVAGAETVAVKGLNLFDLGHTYFGSAAALLHDQYECFHYGVAARFRQRLSPMQREDGTEYWSLDVSSG